MAHSTRTPPRSRRPFRIALAILGVCTISPLLAACAINPGPENMEDGASVLPNGSASSTGSADMPAPNACMSPEEGCPCDQPGTEIACKGSATHDGNYTTCPEGKRECASNGVWGPCKWPHAYIGGNGSAAQAPGHHH